MFWITLRQYMQERQESHSTSTVERMMAPVHVTVGTAAGESFSKLSLIYNNNNNATVIWLCDLTKKFGLSKYSLLINMLLN